MTEQTAYECLVAIHAIFNKVAPARNGPAVTMLAKRVSDIPDSLAEYVVDKISENNTMPQNLSNAFRAAWNRWQGENPNLVARERCPMCQGLGGWTYYKEVEGRWRELFSFCPVCSHKDGHVCKTPAALKDEGLLVLPDHYPGGACGFRRDRRLNVYALEVMP